MTDDVAVVVGAGGGIGGALVAALRDVMRVVALARPTVDLLDEGSLRTAAADVARQGVVRLVVVASGFLHDARFMPEKSFAGLEAAHFAHGFAVNATGPAMVMKHFLPLLPREGRGVFAVLSARVGSIGDNKTGGWYAYRAAKAALNQIVHTAAIELRRQRPEAICVAVHPGTVDTALSAPFAKRGLDVRAPAVAAAEILAMLAGLDGAASGGFYDYKGVELPW